MKPSPCLRLPARLALNVSLVGVLAIAGCGSGAGDQAAGPSAGQSAPGSVTSGAVISGAVIDTAPASPETASAQALFVASAVDTPLGDVMNVQRAAAGVPPILQWLDAVPPEGTPGAPVIVIVPGLAPGEGAPGRPRPLSTTGAAR